MGSTVCTQSIIQCRMSYVYQRYVCIKLSSLCYVSVWTAILDSTRFYHRIMPSSLWYTTQSDMSVPRLSPRTYRQSYLMSICACSLYVRPSPVAGLIKKHGTRSGAFRYLPMQMLRSVFPVAMVPPDPSLN